MPPDFADPVRIGRGGFGFVFRARELSLARTVAVKVLTQPSTDENADRRFTAELQAMGLLNLRSANRAVQGGGPGPEGAMTKLVVSEIGHEAAAIMTELNGSDALFMDGIGGMGNQLVLMHRGMSIAGGTSEIKRNQIGERILGLPRAPLLK